jgi:hypothetical protein
VVLGHVRSWTDNRASLHRKPAQEQASSGTAAAAGVSLPRAVFAVGLLHAALPLLTTQGSGCAGQPVYLSGKRTAQAASVIGQAATGPDASGRRSGRKPLAPHRHD